MSTFNRKRSVSASSLAKNIFIFLLFPVSISLFALSAFFPDRVEYFYSLGLYMVIARVQYFIFGGTNFFIGEFIIYAFVLFLLMRIVFSFKRFKNKKNLVWRLIKACFLYGGIVYFLFIFLWGFNYNRKPLSELLIGRRASVQSDISAHELFECAAEAAERANNLSFLVSRNRAGIFHLTDRTRAEAVMNSKPCIFSVFMSKAGISGLFLPFTGEPAYNRELPDLALPFTSAHEYAHRLGFARENEANMIAYLICANAASPDIRYSAEVTATRYLLSALHRSDTLLFDEVYSLVEESVKKDISFSRAFWKKYQGAFSEISGQVNNLFLKANMQSDGSKSYGRFVELLVFLHREKRSAASRE